jgi:hypothetical protein
MKKIAKLYISYRAIDIFGKETRMIYTAAFLFVYKLIIAIYLCQQMCIFPELRHGIVGSGTSRSHVRACIIIVTTDEQEQMGLYAIISCWKGASSAKLHTERSR